MSSIPADILVIFFVYLVQVYTTWYYLYVRRNYRETARTCYENYFELETAHLHILLQYKYSRVQQHLGIREEGRSISYNSQHCVGRLTYNSISDEVRGLGVLTCCTGKGKGIARSSAPLRLPSSRESIAKNRAASFARSSKFGNRCAGIRCSCCYSTTPCIKHHTTAGSLCLCLSESQSKPERRWIDGFYLLILH